MILLLGGCGLNNDVKIRIEEVNVESGRTFHFITEDSVILGVIFSDSGALVGIVNSTPEYDQLLLFSENTGGLMAKYKKDQTTLMTTGRAYYFYEKSGNLSGDFNYVNGIKSGSAISYHDSTDRI